jgi:fatty acid desaturase
VLAIGGNVQAHRPAIDVKALAADLEALRKELMSTVGPDDLRHLRKMELWGRGATLLGLATAWVAPNPLSAFALSLGTFARWTSYAHPISHRGYDKVPGVAARHTSRVFGKGWRRFVDWFDWILPGAWHEEHDILHHYSLGEEHDPDRVQANTEWIRRSGLPMPARYLLVLLVALTWKWLYYAPNTLRQLETVLARRAGEPTASAAPPPIIGVWYRFFDPRDPIARAYWSRCFLPYFLWQFCVIPALFWPLGSWAALSVLANQVLAELLTNLHGFITIVPNHAGDDLYQFDRPIDDRDEFFLRQIVGSVNFASGSDGVDFLQGWLNYQIEHHLWPAMPLLQYQRAQPRVQAICEKHGVPYRQESVWRRVGKTVDIMVGRSSQQTWETEALPGGPREPAIEAPAE